MMNLEKSKKKLKIYKIALILLITSNLILFACAMTPQFNMVLIFSIFFVLSIIPMIIINKKRKYYKKVVYELEIRETAIKETLNDKILK